MRKQFLGDDSNLSWTHAEHALQDGKASGQRRVWVNMKQVVCRAQLHQHYHHLHISLRTNLTPAPTPHLHACNRTHRPNGNAVSCFQQTEPNRRRLHQQSTHEALLRAKHKNKTISIKPTWTCSTRKDATVNETADEHLEYFFVFCVETRPHNRLTICLHQLQSAKLRWVFQPVIQTCTCPGLKR